jgi:hypothetical protein
MKIEIKKPLTAKALNVFESSLDIARASIKEMIATEGNQD